MSEQNKALFRRFIDDFNKQNVNVVDELMAADFVEHNPAPNQAPGLEGMKEMMGMFFSAFPDLHSTIEDMVSEEDKVALRWRVEGTHTGEFMGVPPSNRKITLDVTEIFRIENGQLVEAWDQFDRLGLMQQIGAIPMPEAESRE